MSNLQTGYRALLCVPVDADDADDIAALVEDALDLPDGEVHVGCFVDLHEKEILSFDRDLLALWERVVDETRAIKPDRKSRRAQFEAEWMEWHDTPPPSAQYAT